MLRLRNIVDTSMNEETEPLGFKSAFVTTFDILLENAEIVDTNCRFNIESIGSRFKRDIYKYTLSSHGKEAEDTTPVIFCQAYRFLCELDFHQDLGNVPEAASVHNFVDENAGLFSKEASRQLHFAAYLMPARIVRKIIRDPAIDSFKNFSRSVNESSQLKKDWDEQILERTELLKGLSENIKNLASEYNFVGLVHGFKALRSQKKKELAYSFFAMLALGTLLIVVPLAQLSFVSANLADIDKHKLILMYSLPPLLAAEIILLYFFRVVLSQFRSVKAQLLQIDLRISLCQFIESYAQYASTIRKEESTTLNRFEALIFSGLVTEGAEIPSTFDGIEQIAGIIKSIRS